jgi:hypothetical protein
MLRAVRVVTAYTARINTATATKIQKRDLKKTTAPSAVDSEVSERPHLRWRWLGRGSAGRYGLPDLDVFSDPSPSGPLPSFGEGSTFPSDSA